MDPNLMAGGGGGGGGQPEVCGLVRTDCEGSGCRGEATMGITTHHMACKVNGVTIRTWIERPSVSDTSACCFN